MYPNEVTLLFDFIMCSAVELDAIFNQALACFRSNGLESHTNLKSLLNEALENSKRAKDNKESMGNSGKPLKPSLKPSKPGSEHWKKEKEQSHKRHFDKVQRDLDEINQEISKKVFRSSPNGVTPGSSSQPSSMHNSPSHEFVPQNHIVTNFAGKSSPLTSLTPDDFELEMDNLACTVCKKITMGSGNQLTECQECHNMYHQSCHQPPISDQEINDPRCIWYCAVCKRNMKKQAKQHIKPPSIMMGNSLDMMREKVPLVESRSNSTPIATPFKRTEMKTNITSSSGAGPLQGWAQLSGKTIKSPKQHPHLQQQHPEDHLSSHPLDPRLEHASHKLKDKSSNKPLKNHTKPTSKFSVSDAWAEALGAKSGVKSDPKGQKSALNSQAKLAPPAAARTNSHEAKPPHKISSNSLLGAKTAPFPKISASTTNSSGGKNKNSVQSQENAAKRLQMTKKKAEQRMQQKRSRV